MKTAPAVLMTGTLILASFATNACVKRSTHQAALDDLSQVRVSREETRTRLEQRDAELAALTRSLAVRQDSLARVRDQLARSELRRDQAEVNAEELRAERQRLQALLAERGTAYDQLESRLEQLSAIEREVRQRNRIYEDVVGRFRSLIDAGRLTVSIDRGRLVINLPQDILFASGSATIGPEGGRTLAEVASAIAGIEDRQFQVEGHTDDVPISTDRFPSNWELSTARALSVVRLLVERGVDPGALSGAGYGEFQPVASNDTPEDRRRNRRIEIVMRPNLDVIATAQLPGS